MFGSIPRALVFVRPHNRDDPLGDGGICGIGRMEGERFIVVIDFEHHRGAFEIKDAEIVLLVRVIGVGKIIKDADSGDQAFDRFGT